MNKETILREKMNKKTLKQLDYFATIIVCISVIGFFTSIWLSGWIIVRVLLTSILLCVWGNLIWFKVKK